MGKVFAIGDVHGCLFALQTLLAAVQPGKDDTVIFLGDLIDRGTDSAGVLRCVADLGQQTEVRCVLGNHEVFLYRAAYYKDIPTVFLWLRNGGKETLRSLGLTTDLHGAFAVPETVIHQIQAMQDYLEYPQWIFTHASVNPKKPLAEQTPAELRWRIAPSDENHQHISGKITVCGHTTQINGLPLVKPGYICLDTYACGGGWLTALEMHSWHYVQSNEKGEVREGKIDPTQLHTDAPQE